MQRTDPVWFALADTATGVRGVLVVGRNRFEALQQVSVQLGACHVLKLKRTEIALPAQRNS